jgi:hypothetical protein
VVIYAYPSPNPFPDYYYDNNAPILAESEGTAGNDGMGEDLLAYITLAFPIVHIEESTFCLRRCASCNGVDSRPSSPTVSQA